jgi:amino acid transporter
MDIKQLFRTKSIASILQEVERHPDVIDSHGNAEGLKRDLRVRDLTALGVAALVGAGIFSTIGSACYDGGPAVSLLFLGIAVACGFSALCYAEFASRIPVAGSAYTYSYAVFGELIAWIIGWDLLLEYAIGNITVAISWSGNFTNFLHGFGIDLPQFLTTSFLEAKNNMPELWAAAPKVLGVPFIINIPAFVINLFITILVYIGIKESKNFANAMVLFKVIVILIIIAIGAFYITPANWSPFAPNGISGVLKGVSAVFFAYIGFDAISTTAEECKNPQRDLPRGMLYSLLISTVLYVGVTLVLTGMVHYTHLKTEAFLATAFQRLGLNWVGGLVAFSALVATASVMLVFQIGQPRIWMSMSRDGLLPKKFAEVHPKYKTPAFATILTGLIVGIPSLFLDASLVTDMCSIGTLFAFILVCGGVIVLQQRDKNNTEDDASATPKFKIPFINGQYIVPMLSILFFILFFKDASNIEATFPLDKGFSAWKHQIPFWAFLITTLYVSYQSFMKNWSLIPVLGFLSCAYLLSTLGFANWMRFLVWMALGLVIYFSYSVKNSKLNTP